MQHGGLGVVPATRREDSLAAPTLRGFLPRPKACCCTCAAYTPGTAAAAAAAVAAVSLAAAAAAESLQQQLLVLLLSISSPALGRPCHIVGDPRSRV